jgi:hypothetical protein
LLHGGELAERASIPPASYRETHGHAASDEAVTLLAARLDEDVNAAADPRALACVIAAEIGAIELAPRVSALTNCPHPLIAAVSRAAALRLGTDVCRVGALDELVEFVPPADLELIQRWAISGA